MRYPRRTRLCFFDRAGYVARADAREIGFTVVDLGGGRARKGDPVDPAVGVVLLKKIGERVQAGEPLALVHAREQLREQAADQDPRSTTRGVLDATYD